MKTTPVSHHQKRRTLNKYHSSLSLGLFILLAVLITYPVSFRLADFSVLSRYADTLLQSWTLAWDVHALLAGSGEVQNFWNANIFYPYPLTLAFSEHLLATALIVMPFTLLGSTPLVPANLGILFTTALSGWGMYLLVTWLTGNRWAGLVAGIFFAMSPFRMGHLVHLNLLSTHWLPFIFLAAARLVRFNKNKDVTLLIIFVNLQFFSVINYATMIALGLIIWLIFHLVAYRHRIGLSLLIRLGVFGLITMALNWPVLRIYRQMSQQMGIVRTLGDARILANSIEHYIKPMANSLLYARWLNFSTLFDSAFPGIVVVGLALSGIFLLLKTRSSRYLMGATVTLLLIIFMGFALSFGANEQVFGERLAPVIVPLLPYPYLYDLIPLFQGFRVPARFALLVTFGLAILAGIGFAELSHRFWPRSKQALVAFGLLGALIFVEHLPAPIPGESVDYGGEVYAWLADRSADSAVLELPYYLHTDQSELPRVYQSVRHWQPLVNGNSGFEPVWLVELGKVLDGFPDWRSFDAIRRLGVDYVVLHRSEYQPQDWDNLVALLPGYLPSIEAIYSVGGDLILQLKPSGCTADLGQVQADASLFPELSIANGSSATFVADPNRISSLIVGQQASQFLEPLFVSPGQTLTFDLPVDNQTGYPEWRVNLANLDYTLTNRTPSTPLPVATSFFNDDFQPVQIPFGSGAVLQAMALEASPEPCGRVVLNLVWSFPEYTGEVVQVELIDRFGRVVVGDESQPFLAAAPVVSSHILPLAETVPPGSYQLRVRLLSAAGADIPAIGPAGASLTEPVTAPIVIQPSSRFTGAGEALPALPGGPALFHNGIRLLGAEVAADGLQSGDWLRYTLVWQPEQAIDTDLTVFTQLLGPDGQVWGQQDNQPKGGWYGTSLWEPGRLVADDYAFQVPLDAPSGSYRLIAGLYDPVTLERVPVQASSGQPGDFVDVGPVQIGE